MAVNTIALATNMAKELDKAVVHKSATGFLADNAFRAKFIDAATVILADIDFQGLGNYDRSDGFVDGALTLKHTPYVLEMDRGRTFYLDNLDAQESGIANLAGQVMGEFTRTKVIPELDAYVLSKLSSFATGKGNTVTGTLANNSYKLFNAACRKVWDFMGYEESLVAFVDSAFWGDLLDTTEISRHIVTSDFKRGEINTKVKSINSVPIMPVSSSLMKDAFVFYDGETSGQEIGGFTPDTGAKNVGLIVLPKRAASLIRRHEKPRIFSPDVNQKMDAWKFDYRFCYDVFTKKSLNNSIVTYTY